MRASAHTTAASGPPVDRHRASHVSPELAATAYEEAKAQLLARLEEADTMERPNEELRAAFAAVLLGFQADGTLLIEFVDRVAAPSVAPASEPRGTLDSTPTAP